MFLVYTNDNEFLICRTDESLLDYVKNNPTQIKTINHVKFYEPKIKLEGDTIRIEVEKSKSNFPTPLSRSGEKE